LFGERCPVTHGGCSIRRKKAAVKGDGHVLAANRSQRKRLEVIFVNGRWGALALIEEFS
jgi:hypothetical protein